jgi:hypothetical protein
MSGSAPSAENLFTQVLVDALRLLLSQNSRFRPCDIVQSGL